MNKRISKLLNRWPALKELHPKSAKRAWKNTPKHQRHNERVKVEREIEDLQ